MNDTVAHAVRKALRDLAGETPLRAGAAGLLNALGYSSQRTAEAGRVEEFIERFERSHELTGKQRKLFHPWNAIEIVFQFTAGEITTYRRLFESSGFEENRIESFLFLAVDMAEDAWTRTHLAETARVVNRFFKMPVILLFRYGSTLTLAAVHRRAHKREDSEDVLERVTLVKDIRLEDPHRAHIDILSDLAFSNMIDAGVRSFDELHAKWEQTLDIQALNKRFYRELFAWFEHSVEACSFPDDGGGAGGTERHVIRLITRLLFIWFLKEKHLVPEELFEEEFAHLALKNYAPDGTDYYRAVLQNLFFATLNTEINRRSYSNQGGDPGRHDFNEYRYRDLLVNPDAFVETLEKVPFVNGGLFDCLDDFAVAAAERRQVDAFTDYPIQGGKLCVPARLFLDSNDGLFELFRRYKFTIEESTPLDQEVALDPELLGRVFENLLAAYNPETRKTARKATGSYYTPRPVVDYMVREALSEALAVNAKPSDPDSKWWHERIDYLLDHASAMGDAGEFFDVDEKREIVSAIADLKVLDPAVGSGAFPMGILQTLTLALRRLDPDNVLWEEIQKKRAKARAGEAFDTRDQPSRDEALREISATFEKYRQSDFGRKLYLIQNGIFGVDIQPIACQIAKLRFFISLVIEQDPARDAPNLGIKPLPNLETRLVAADSLCRLKPEADTLFLDDAVASKQREVAALRERYFLADSRPRKLQCVESQKRMRRKLQELLETDRRNWIAVQEREIESKAERFPNAEARETCRENELRKLALRRREYDDLLADARMIAEWDPYDQNGVAQWFDSKHMFGVERFDVVIGNPPYIQLQKNGGEMRRKYQGAGYEVFASAGDVYQLFFERGMTMAREGAGVLAYITSNSWLKAEYGRRLRQYFANRHTPLTLVEMGKSVFENAIVDTAVLIVRNGRGRALTCPAVDVEQTPDGRFPPPNGDWGTLKMEGERPWMALSSVERSVMQKMEAVGMPLKQWDISIYYGIKTGFNDAFIVDTETKEALVAEDPNSAKILKPILRGRDIQRYRAQWAGLWLIDMHNGYQGTSSLDADDFPAIRDHLNKFWTQIERRQDQGATPYNLRNCAYHEEFAKSKLFWMHMAPYGRFALGEKGMMCNQKAFMVTGCNLNYLCAVLNSALVTWFAKHTSVTTGMGLTQWDKFTVERIPIAQPDSSVLRWFHNAVDELLTAIRVSDAPSTEELQRAIDRAVLDLYGITAKEIVRLDGR